MTQTLERTTLPPRPAPATRRSEWPRRVVPILCMLLGALVMAYPVAGTYYNNYTQHRFASRYGATMSGTPAGTLKAQLDRAHRYNERLGTSSLQDPWSTGAVESTAPYRDYLSQLALVDIMARLRAPSIGVDLPVYHGTSEQTLSRGVGHLFGSSMPVGGPSTHAVFTAHSAFQSATLFTHLPQIRLGDIVYVDVYGETLAYRVDRTKVVLPTQLDSIRRRAGADEITLVTCTPYAVNTHRLLVRAHRIPYDPAADPARKGTGVDWSIQSWMLPRLIGAAAALLALLIMLALWIRGDRRAEKRRRVRALARQTSSHTPTAGAATDDAPTKQRREP